MVPTKAILVEKRHVAATIIILAAYINGNIKDLILLLLILRLYHFRS